MFILKMNPLCRVSTWFLWNFPWQYCHNLHTEMVPQLIAVVDSRLLWNIDKTYLILNFPFSSFKVILMPMKNNNYLFYSALKLGEGRCLLVIVLWSSCRFVRSSSLISDNWRHFWIYTLPPPNINIWLHFS